MTDYDWIWQTIAIFLAGKIILRLGGRKSISQMTITQVIVMVGIGSLLIQPVAGRGLFITFGVALLITLLMIISEIIEMKFDLMETLATGKSVIVIENGQLNLKNLRKLRMSVDRLETRLRQSGIASIADVKYATIEISGQLGYELVDYKKPLTKEDFVTLMSEITSIKKSMNISTTNTNHANNLFNEIKTNKNEGKKEPN